MVLMGLLKSEYYEIAVGLGVSVFLIIIISFVFMTKEDKNNTAIVVAKFNNVDGLKVGDHVRAAGISVGKITKISIDEDFKVITVLRIIDTLLLDEDTTASIVTDGLFGEKSIQLSIGGSEKLITNGGEINFTEDSLILDDLLELIVNQKSQYSKEAN
jgi:phospholipid/cholesterol/gamma-HCH transport system substrate-binding protein|tara:strand:+ start:1344 stop:1817 length:474 start_codon:yes stop_codon:yes gene_type:complete